MGFEDPTVFSVENSNAANDDDLFLSALRRAINDNDWQQMLTLTPGLREKVAYQAITSIFANIDPQVLSPEMNLMAEAMRIEADCYERATSLNEYAYLICEKMFFVRKDLEDQRKKQKKGSRANVR